MTTRKLIITLSLVAGLCAGTSPANASDAEIAALREQLQLLTQRLDELEVSNRELKQSNEQLQESSAKTADAVASKSSSAGWTDKIKLGGDFRMRYENIDEAGKSSRNRNRVRARASIVAQVNEDVEVALAIASGSDDPVSTNQTLGNGGSTKDLGLDMAYFKWSGLENAYVVGGKFKNFLFKPGKNGLLWDGDWNPEGLGFAWSDGDYFFNAMGTWLESDSKNETEFTTALQAGFKKKVGENAKLTAGIGFYNFDTEGKGTFYGNSDDFFGNSFNGAANTYMYNYEIINVFADLGFELAGKPASVFVDFIKNQDAGQYDGGFAAGFNYGSAKNPGTWDFGYVYQDLEADAALGLLVDSDFGGGGTDVNGHVLRFGYAIAKNWNANLTYFINEAGENAGNMHDYDRFQLDLGFKY